MKCAEIVFEQGKMVKGEGLEVLEEKMKATDPDENDICTFLGIEQADGIKTKKVFERVKGEVNKRVKILTTIELNGVNLVRAINTNVIPVAAYSMNVYKFTDEELKELDQVSKRELRSKNMLGKQSRDERLYLWRWWKRNKIAEDHLQRNEAESCLLYSLLAKQVDQSCMEKREHQGGEFNSRGSNKDNWGCWSRDSIWRRQHPDRWRADWSRMETSMEETEREAKKGNEEVKDRWVRKKRAPK